LSTLSEVSILIAQNAGDIELAREVFTTETRRFVEGALESIRKARSDPWTSGRVRIDLPREIENEPKAVAYLSRQYALARADVRFKKGTKFIVAAEAPFGLSFAEGCGSFVWEVRLVPAARYPRLDDILWRLWRTKSNTLPGAVHQEKANTILFVSRPVSKELTLELAFTDLKTILEFLLGAADALAEAVGFDLTPAEEEGAA
jgi:hypothetical protein